MSRVFCSTRYPFTAHSPDAFLMLVQVASDVSQATLGYLPGPLAALLAPLVIPGIVRLSCTFLEAPRTATSPVPIQLQVSFSFSICTDFRNFALPRSPCLARLLSAPQSVGSLKRCNATFPVPIQLQVSSLVCIAIHIAHASAV